MALSDWLQGDGRAEQPAGTDPIVRAVSVDDISACLVAGMRDFQAAPIYGLFFGGVYALGGLLILWLALSYQLAFLAYPLAAGFALIGPLVAVGLYEVSRRRETGEPLSFGVVMGAIGRHGGQEMGWMALVSVFALIIWVYVAGWLYAIFFGMSGLDFGDIVDAVFTTPRGAAFFVIGSLIGAGIVLVVFSITVVSFPLILDRDTDFVTAMITSVRAVSKSPGPMIGWGIFVAFLLALALLPLFAGLVVVLPVLGHATWHLYRRLVVLAAPEA